MAAKDRMAVLSAMMEQGVIPVFYHSEVEVCVNVIQACANGGAKCAEFTNRGDFAAHVFFDVTSHFAKADPSVIMGVGSVVDAPTAGIYIANGAKFVVGPLISADVAKVCNRRGIPYSPGCGSATEIGDAQELGCEIVKVFPGSSVGGPDFVKSVMGPMPWTRIMPTGGVEPHRDLRSRRPRRCPRPSRRSRGRDSRSCARAAPARARGERRAEPGCGPDFPGALVPPCAPRSGRNRARAGSGQGDSRRTMRRPSRRTARGTLRRRNSRSPAAPRHRTARANGCGPATPRASTPSRRGSRP